MLWLHQYFKFLIPIFFHVEDTEMIDTFFCMEYICTSRCIIHHFSFVRRLLLYVFRSFSCARQLEIDGSICTCGSWCCLASQSTIYKVWKGRGVVAIGNCISLHINAVVSWNEYKERVVILKAVDKTQRTQLFL